MLVGSGWRSEWVRRCGKPFRDVCGALAASESYTQMVAALVERGVGVREEAAFAKFLYADLAPATKMFLKEAGVPAWSFGLQRSTEITFREASNAHAETPPDAEPPVPKRHRAYKDVVFEGSPPQLINDTKTFLSVIRHILGKAEQAGDACVRFKEELGGKGRTMCGTCNAEVCVGCTWKMLARLTLDSKGLQHLEIKADGEHGSRAVAGGSRLWTETERALLAATFPGDKRATVKEVRAAFEAKNMPLRCTEQQLKQWVTRHNRQKAGQPQRQTITVEEMKASVERWVQQQPATFADATLSALRVVGTPIHTAKQICIAWSAWGFLNHLRGLKADRPLCVTVDGKQRISTTGAVIATVGIMATSGEPRNTTVSREDDGKKLQMQLKTSTVQPLMQAYIDSESNENWTWVFECLCELVQAEFGVCIREQVLQVQADFHDGIEHARRHVFPRSRPANDYPHMMRAAQATLSKKTDAAWRQRVLRVIRVARHLPTLELFNAVWECFFQELRANRQETVSEYLQKEYLKQVPTDTLGKMYQVRSSPNLPKKLWWADYWAGTLGTHPGSATGTQTLEAFHSFWHRQIRDQVRANPTQILQVMQNLYNGQWKTWMREDGGKVRA